MSTAAPDTTTTGHDAAPPASDGHDAHGHAHTPHLAHHFDTMGQQFDAAKLGMWVFLATEILMFGGLFCAYAVYRANNPDIFAFAHKELDTTLGAINTVVLIASSLTMAWAVRASQLGQTKILCWCLALSLLGGLGFMTIKTIEYSKKWNHHLWVGANNKYHPGFTTEAPADDKQGADNADKADQGKTPAPAGATGDIPAKVETEATPAPQGPIIDRSATPPPAAGPAGLNPALLGKDQPPAATHTDDHAHAGMQYADLSPYDQKRVHIFFQIYFLMTGLHGLHVLIGMGLMTWLLVRAAKGEFGPKYFIPVDLVGLYWHLVDLIWIFLFPLLYLIH